MFPRLVIVNREAKEHFISYFGNVAFDLQNCRSNQNYNIKQRETEEKTLLIGCSYDEDRENSEDHVEKENWEMIAKKMNKDEKRKITTFFILPVYINCTSIEGEKNRIKMKRENKDICHFIGVTMTVL